MASTRLRPVIEKRMLRPSLILAVVRETVTDTSFDTNPAQQRETQGNTGGGYLACLCRFRNHEQRSETQRLRLRIRRSQVRVLPSALLKYLQTGLNNKGPGHSPGPIYCNRYSSRLSIAFSPVGVERAAQLIGEVEILLVLDTTRGH